MSEGPDTKHWPMIRRVRAEKKERGERGGSRSPSGKGILTGRGGDWAAGSWELCRAVTRVAVCASPLATAGAQAVCRTAHPCRDSVSHKIPIRPAAIITTSRSHLCPINPLPLQQVKDRSVESSAILQGDSKMMMHQCPVKPIGSVRPRKVRRT
ncbi:hypothetical protein SRHO_G00301220 [Serrasalmus rhombeus]